MEQDILEFIEDKFCGRVLITLYLIAYHLALFLYFMLGIGAMEHDITEHIDGFFYVLSLNSAVENSVFLVGEGVEFAT